MIEFAIIHCFVSLLYMVTHCWLGHITIAVIDQMTFETLTLKTLGRLADGLFVISFVTICLWTFIIVLPGLV